MSASIHPQGQGVSVDVGDNGKFHTVRVDGFPATNNSCKMYHRARSTDFVFTQNSVGRYRRTAADLCAV